MASRFSDMSKYERPTKEKEMIIQLNKQREFNGFIRGLAIYCFNDCVNSFPAGEKKQT